MWDNTTSSIKKATREVLGASWGNFGGRQRFCWWNGEVQGNVKAKVAYEKFMECKDEEERGTGKEIDKATMRMTNLAVATTKTTTLSDFILN